MVGLSKPQGKILWGFVWYFLYDPVSQLLKAMHDAAFQSLSVVILANIPCLLNLCLPTKLLRPRKIFMLPFLFCVWMLNAELPLSILLKQVLSKNTQNWQKNGIFLFNWKNCITPWSNLMIHALFWVPYVKVALVRQGTLSMPTKSLSKRLLNLVEEIWTALRSSVLWGRLGGKNKN